MSLTTYNIVVDIHFKLDQSTVLRQMVATQGFRTDAFSDPAGYHVMPRLKSVGTYTQELFSSARMTGPVKPSVGELILANDDGQLDSWIGYGTAGGEVYIYLGAEGATFPTDYTLVIVAQLFNVVADFEEVRLRLRDRSYLLDKPVVTDTFQGTGDLEGPAGFSAKKPLVIQDPGYVPAVLLDPQKQIYFLQANTTRVDISTTDNPLFGQVYEGGTRIVRGANYSSFDGLQYEEPTEGTVRFYWGPVVSGYAQGPVYFRLKAPPVFDIRVSAYGMIMDVNDSIVFDQPHYWSMTSLCRRAGLTDVTPASMAAWANDDNLIPPQYIADDRTYLEVLQSAAFSTQSFFGFDRLNKFFCSTVGSPSTFSVGVTPVATFTLDKSSNVRRGFLSDMEGPVWQVTVNAGETWPSNLTNGASNDMREALSRTPWQFAITGTSDPTKYNYVNAVQAVLETKARLSVPYVLGLYFSLYGAPRDVISFEVPVTNAHLALNLNDIVKLTMPRFGCSSGRLMRICALSLNLSTRLLAVSVWGGTPWGLGYVTGGGTTYNGGFGGGIGSGSGATTLVATAPGRTLTLASLFYPGATSNVAGKVLGRATMSLAPGLATGSAVGAAGPAVHAIPVTAAAMRPQAVGGCSNLSASAGSTGPDLLFLGFSATTLQAAQFGIPMPSTWDEGTVTLKFHWSHPTTATAYGVYWGVKAVAVGDGDALSAAFGAAQVVTDTGGTADTMYTTSMTAALTVAGSPAAGDYVYFQVYRDPTQGADTLAVTARLHAVSLFATLGSGDA